MRTLGVYRTIQIASLVVLLAIGASSPLLAQLAQVSHFVSPSYPPLARQALISGQVTLTVNVDKDGLVTGASEAPSAHPLLAQWAKECIGEWKFQSASRERKVTVVFYYGFSGTTRESDPKTTVKADFVGSSVRVFITTDPAPSVHP